MAPEAISSPESRPKSRRRARLGKKKNEKTGRGCARKLGLDLKLSWLKLVVVLAGLSAEDYADPY